VSETPLVPNHIVADGASLVGPPVLEPDIEYLAYALALSQGLGELGNRFDDVNRLREVQQETERDATDAVFLPLTRLSAHFLA
jgi:hypothetical protein